MDSEVKKTNWGWYILLSIILIIVIVLINDKRRGGQGGRQVNKNQQDRIISELSIKASSANFDKESEDKILSNLQQKSKTQAELSNEERMQIIDNLKNITK